LLLSFVIIYYYDVSGKKRATILSRILIYTQMITKHFAFNNLRKKMQRNRSRALRADNFILDFSFVFQVRSLHFSLNGTPPPVALRLCVILTSITYVSSHVYTDIDINNE